ncbi:MAG: hypothetical protein Q8N96_02140 [Methylovulum sp.]|nr:hypothetical protein [Methylovulum sp.]
MKNISQLNQSSDCGTVETFSQLDDGNSVEIISQYEMNDTVRIAFYTVGNGVKKRQVIALDGFYVNALMLVAGVDKKGVPAWVQREVDGWLAFDSRLPITRQVKYLIVRELTQRVKNSTG